MRPAPDTRQVGARPTAPVPPRRRIALAALAALAPCALAFGQAPRRARRIGLILYDMPPEWMSEMLQPPLAELGWEEGRDYVFVARASRGDVARLDALAAELAALPADLIVAPGNREVAAARRATREIPILMMFGVAPVESGLVASLARPGGNVTGTTTNTPEIAGKMIEALRATLPGARRVTRLAEADHPGLLLYQQHAERAAAAVGLALVTRTVRTPDEVEVALREVEQSRPDALLVSMTGPLLPKAQRLVEFCARNRLPALYTSRFATSIGGLMSYSQDMGTIARRHAAMIDRIFRGASPADIPVEQPVRLELTINLKAARAIGLAIPQPALLRADNVIE